MDKIYIVIETSYAGPTYCFETGPLTAKYVADRVDEAKAYAFDTYRSLSENYDVPDAELYKSLFVREVSTFLPREAWDVKVTI